MYILCRKCVSRYDLCIIYIYTTVSDVVIQEHMSYVILSILNNTFKIISYLFKTKLIRNDARIKKS